MIDFFTNVPNAIHLQIKFTALAIHLQMDSGSGISVTSKSRGIFPHGEGNRLKFDRPQNLIQTLQSLGLKMTRQRKLIIEKMSGFQVPFSAEDLYMRGLKRSGIDLATIYRTLHLLKEKNCITPLDVSDGHVRYTTKPATKHLHTLLCKSCQKIEHLSSCFVEKQQEELMKKGFTHLTHKVEFTGLCPDCAMDSSHVKGATL